MKLKQFKNRTLTNGGCSMSINGIIPTSGYMVGIAGNERILNKQDFNLKNIRAYVSDKFEKLVEPNMFIGSWENKGKIYLDTSMNISNKEEAIRIARELGELAIFDIENGETIYL